MDPANRRPQLPPVGFLDMEKARRDEDLYQNRNAGAQQTLPPTTVPSPYPSGPPPPYSHPLPPQQHYANTLPGSQAGVRTPPESRRTSGDEKEAVKQTVRQSLPSISEALGVDNQPAYHATLPPQTTPASLHQQAPGSVARSSPSPTRRAYAMEPPQVPAEHQSHGHPHYAQYRQEAPPQQSYPPMDTPRAAFAESRPPLHLQTAQSPSVRPSQQPSSYPPPAAQPEPVYEQPPAQASSSMAPPQFPYGYQPYPPRYAQPSPQPSSNQGPIYQPSLTNAAPPTPAANWKSESARFGPDERAYGDSVKRHLDLYDLEAALDQVTQTSSIMTDFARRYGDRLHQQSRSGPTMSSLPGMVEVEDMMSKSRLQFEALSKIRDVVVAQQVAHDQQAAEQRQQQKAFIEAAPPSSATSEDDRGGFAAGDAKKRRGRAAPPGRCHSCNRAETPEWRRGPDGARTLCNACGLHYAKLTRKQNSANKNPAASSSNLRPKEAI